MTDTQPLPAELPAPESPTALPRMAPDPDAPAAPPVADLPPAECAARLAALFPAVFTPGTPRPLKLRIQADVQQRAPGVFTKKSLSVFLHRHTTSNSYLKALAGAPARIDLDGEPAGEVSDEHRQAAAAEVERRRALHDARRVAEREAQRAAYDQARRARAAEQVALQAAIPDGGASPRPPRSDRAPRQRGGGHDMRGPRPPAEHAPLERPLVQQRPVARQVSHEPPVARPVIDEAQRARAALLHAYETTTLTRANFCALKGWTDADLELALIEARREREQRGPVSRPNPPPQSANAPREAPRHAPRGDAGRPGRRGPPGGARPPR